MSYQIKKFDKIGKDYVGWPSRWDFSIEYLHYLPVELFQQQAAAGNERAFSIIFVRYWNWVYEICWKILKQEEWSEEAAQTTFVHLWRRSKFDPAKSLFSTWLGNLARWASYRKLTYEHGIRRKTEQSFLSLDTEIGENRGSTFYDIISDSTENRQDQVLYMKELEGNIMEFALKSLRGVSFSVFYLRFRGHTNEEIAQMLGKSQTCITSTVFNNKIRMRDHLKKLGVFINDKVESPEF